MKDNSDQSELEWLPFLRSPDGCLVSVFCLLVGGCFCGLLWLKGCNRFTFELEKGRTVVVCQARDKEFDQYTTYDFQIWVYENDHLIRSMRTGGIQEMVNEMRARTAADGNVVGILWPGSEKEYLFIYDFRDKHPYTNWPPHQNEMSDNQAKRLYPLLNTNSHIPTLIAR